MPASLDSNDRLSGDSGPAKNARSWVGSFGTNLLIAVIGVVTGVVSARLLTPHGRGQLAEVIIWPNLIASLGSLSIREVVIVRCSRATEPYSRIVSTALCCSLFIAWFWCLVGTALLPGLLGDSEEQLASIAVHYLWVLLPANAVTAVFFAADHGRRRFRSYNLQRIVPPGSYLIGLGALACLDQLRVRTVAYANVAGTLAIAIWRSIRFVSEHPMRPSATLARELVSQGVRFHGLTVILTIATQADQLILVAANGERAIGIYLVGLTVASSAFALVSNSTYDVLFPFLSSSKDADERKIMIGQGARSTTLALSVIATSLAAIASPLILVLFGNAYSDSIAVCRVLLVAHLLIAMRQMLARAVRGVGLNSVGTGCEAIALFALVVFTQIGVFESDPLGIAAALALSGLIAYIALIALVSRRLEMKWRDLVGMDRRTCGDLHRHLRLGWSVIAGQTKNTDKTREVQGQ